MPIPNNSGIVGSMPTTRPSLRAAVFDQPGVRFDPEVWSSVLKALGAPKDDEGRSVDDAYIKQALPRPWLLCPASLHLVVCP